MPDIVTDTDIPLVVDVDGALLKTDLLIESAFVLLTRKPWLAAKLPFWLASGKAFLKQQIANRCELPADAHPWNDDVLELIRTARANGRRVFLASASDEKFIREIADHLGSLDGIFASNGITNLSRERKAQWLVEAFGRKGFDYVGNSRDDLPVWAAAREAIVVNPRPAMVAAARHANANLRVLGSPALLIAGLIRTLRPVQWLKNLLVFVPIVAGHAINTANVAASLATFVAFCLAASSAYCINDLADLANDRRHPRKRLRPLASGALPVMWGLMAAPLLALTAAVIAGAVSTGALATLALYYAATLSYSFYVKRKLVMDVMTLAALYTIRIVAGGAATGVPVSEWLLAFAIFLFLSLAVVKRCDELASRKDETPVTGDGRVAGRGYIAADLGPMAGIGAAAGFCAVLVLALYINSDQVMSLYTRPHLLWACCFVLMYWITRMVLLGQRGDLHDDPVVFAATDKASLAAFAIIAVTVALAA